MILQYSRNKFQFEMKILQKRINNLRKIDVILAMLNIENQGFKIKLNILKNIIRIDSKII